MQLLPISFNMLRGHGICLEMQREQERITHSHVHDQGDRHGKQNTDRETEGLKLEIETCSSCTVLNAKHVSAYWRAWLSQPFRPLPCLLFLRVGGKGLGMSELAVGCFPA